MTGESADLRETRFGRRRQLGLIAGPLACAIMLALPAPEGLAEDGWRTAAVAALMAIWWLSEAIPVSATALLPLVLFPSLGIGDISATAAPYANPLIFLFLGGFLIALTIQRWNLHKRIALNLLRLIGSRPAMVVGGFMVVSALLSMWVSNTAAAAIMLPMGLSVSAVLDSSEGETSGNFTTALMLGIAYGATIGGLATLIGTPPNALLAAYMLEAHGREIGFAEWMAVGLPLACLLLPLSWLWLTRIAFPLPATGAAAAGDAVREELRALGPATRPEILTAIVFFLTALLWITRPAFAPHLPGFSVTDSQIAILGGLLMFIIPAGGGRTLLSWRWANRLPWRVLVLFGGGLTLAAAIHQTGLADWIGGGISALDAPSLILLALATVTLVVFLTEFTSNTATAAAFLPIAGAIAASLGYDVILLAAPVALAASCAFMMPVATPPNAIIFGSGRVTIPQMCRGGIGLNVIAIATITSLGLGLTWLVLSVSETL